MLEAIGAKLALGFAWSKAKAISGWSAMSPKMRLYIFAAIAAVLAVVAHQWYAHHQLKTQYQLGMKKGHADQFAYDMAQLTKAHNEALAWKTKFDQSSTARSQKIREHTDAQIAGINRTADNLLRNGPGKARCGQVDYPGLPAGAGGHEPTAQPTGTAVDRVPDSGGDGLIALPFSGTIAVARQCDADRAEVIGWRTWWDQTSKAWPK